MIEIVFDEPVVKMIAPVMTMVTMEAVSLALAITGLVFCQDYLILLFIIWPSFVMILFLTTARNFVKTDHFMKFNY